MIAKGTPDIRPDDILRMTDESGILYRYFGINRLPVLIHSPLRRDRNPSFGLSTDGVKVFFRDFATGESGDIFTLLMRYWSLGFRETLARIWSDICRSSGHIIHAQDTHHYDYKRSVNTSGALLCRTREWQQWDIEYWESYGISLDWLKYADVYPISHKIIERDGRRYVFGADRYAYAYVERKEGRITIKIYQPFNKRGYKWCGKHDRSVVSLWTKVPEYGDRICICSSLKDALCLMANTGIPSLALQGEGYGISDTAVRELRRRYRHICVCFDNDAPGIRDAQKLCKTTGFTNIVPPPFEGGKDISDLFRAIGREEFLSIVRPLFGQ